MRNGLSVVGECFMLLPARRAGRSGRGLDSVACENAEAHHPPGENGLPSEAGMLALIQAALREISTSTTIVAR